MLIVTQRTGAPIQSNYSCFVHIPSPLGTQFVKIHSLSPCNTIRVRFDLIKNFSNPERSSTASPGEENMDVLLFLKIKIKLKN